jgi:hypothetical protein
MGPVVVPHFPFCAQGYRPQGHGGKQDVSLSGFE